MNKHWGIEKDHFLKAINDPWYKVILDLEHNISVLTTEFYENKGMKTLFLPVTTGTISSPMGLGSDSLPVKVNLCGVDTYLADSMQFMLEYGCRHIKKGCYYLMPTFRGESADERHLCQFYHSEAEIEGTLEDVIKLVEEYVIYLSKGLLKNCKESILSVVDNVEHIEKFVNRSNGFPRVTFEEAITILSSYKTDKILFEVNEKEGFRNITKYGEKVLIEHFDGVVWLTHFDYLSVPFYQAYTEDKKYAMNADLLFGIGETVGSGQRHVNYESICEALELHKVNSDEYEWYINMKKEYPLQTSGFGLGVERFILWVLKHNDIRDCQLLSRFNGMNILP